MEYIVLASGSSGNATIIKGQSGIILIDFGLAHRTFLKKLEEINLKVEEIDAVLITHSHGDHLLSPELLEELFPPEKIYSSYFTYKVLDENNLDPYMEIEIAGMHVFTFPLSHDVPTLGFVIIDGDEKLAFIPDTGYLNSRILPIINNSTYFLIESNYNEEMLLNSNRAAQLKKRIFSSTGHLSNSDCGQILTEVVGEKTKAICLMHLSADCNTKELALAVNREMLEQNQKNPNVLIHASSRKEIVKLADLWEKAE